MQLQETLASAQIGFPLLSTLIFLPIAWSLVLLFLRNEGTIRKAAIVGAAVELSLSLVLLVRFVRGTPDVQFAERYAWIPTLNVSYHVGIDGISVLFVPMTALLTLLVMVSSSRTVRTRVKAFHIAAFGLASAAVGIFCALDAVLFFVFWEASLVPIYFLVSLWGVGPERRYAAMKFVLTMLVASGPLLLGIVLLGAHRHAIAGQYDFDWLTLRATPIPPSLQAVVFFLMLVGFAVKGPFFPLHTWMPAMLRECPVGVGVVLTGLKLGSYGVLRFVMLLLPDATARYACDDEPRPVVDGPVLSHGLLAGARGLVRGLGARWRGEKGAARSHVLLAPRPRRDWSARNERLRGRAPRPARRISHERAAAPARAPRDRPRRGVRAPGLRARFPRSCDAPARAVHEGPRARGAGRGRLPRPAGARHRPLPGAGHPHRVGLG
jgi:hypothetical protein